MFEFVKFYNGRKAVSIGNIDHDQIVELVFEMLADIKRDPAWSFAVKPF